MLTNTNWRLARELSKVRLQGKTATLQGLQQLGDDWRNKTWRNVKKFTADATKRGSFGTSQMTELQ